MYTEIPNIDRGQALMHFCQQYEVQRDTLPKRMHVHKEAILKPICAGTNTTNAFAIVLQSEASLTPHPDC